MMAPVPLPTANGRCGLGEGTFATTRGKGRDAPIAVVSPVQRGPHHAIAYGDHTPNLSRNDRPDPSLAARPQRSGAAGNANSVYRSRRVAPCRLSELDRVRRTSASLFRRPGEVPPRPARPA